MDIANTIALLGGLAFFLFGMSLLGEGLKRVAGKKLEVILGKLTSTTLRGVLLGTVVTAVIQSSSATTVMVVGFVNSGLMKLTNAIGIIMGANIGTTATGWILVLAGVEGEAAFSSATVFALIAFIGIILYFFCKKNTTRNVGMILLALSVLMSGMQSMSGAMAPLKESEAFLGFISAVSNPIVSIGVGIVVTAVLQSCSASIGILQALSVTGVISYEIAIPMVLGMCIGACVPVLISAIGANVGGKRTALVYLLFNVIGTVVLLIPFYIINAFVKFGFMSTAASSMGIAVFNTVYKVAATIMLIPFAGSIERLVCSIVKEGAGDEDLEAEDNLLDERFLRYPSLALEQCRQTLRMMTETSFKNLRKSIELIGDYSPEGFQKVQRREDKVDRYEDELGEYLVQLNAQELTVEETRIAARYLSSLSNLERISDHAVNLSELAQELDEKKIFFSDQAVKELTICADAVREILDITQQAVIENDIERAGMVEPLEEVIDALTDKIKERHIQRLQSGKCTLELGFILNDCVHNFERTADHCSNLAVAVLEAYAGQMESHKYLRTFKQVNSEEYSIRLAANVKKYCDALDSLDTGETEQQA